MTKSSVCRHIQVLHNKLTFTLAHTVIYPMERGRSGAPQIVAYPPVSSNVAGWKIHSKWKFHYRKINYTIYIVYSCNTEICAVDCNR